MDELEKKPDAPQEAAEKKPEKKNNFDNRRKVMYVLCGGYLIYLAIKMGRDYPGLAASGVWSSERIAALCGTIAFSIIGAANWLYSSGSVARVIKLTFAFTGRAIDTAFLINT